MFMAFGQFISHEITHGIPSKLRKCRNKTRNYERIIVFFQLMAVLLTAAQKTMRSISPKNCDILLVMQSKLIDVIGFLVTTMFLV